MKQPKLLADAFYDGQIEHMSDLANFPQLPKGQQEIRRALRRISQTDETFIRRLISDVVDSNTTCPTPAELIRRAGAMRQRAPKSIGASDCEQCHGSGWISYSKRVSPAGLAPYEVDVSKPCGCRG